jgi:plastocyanin
MRTIPLALLAGAAFSTWACSDNVGPDAGEGPPAAMQTVEVQDDRFVAPSVRVLEGGTVRWTWEGNNLHNVTFAGGPSSGTQLDGAFERTFATAGTYPYLCTVHGQSMSGTVTVVAQEGEAP